MGSSVHFVAKYVRNLISGRSKKYSLRERTLHAAIARKQETIKANCWRKGGREGGREDGCCHIPRRPERAREEREILNEEKTFRSDKVGRKSDRSLDDISHLWSRRPHSTNESGRACCVAQRLQRRGHIDPTATSKGMPDENMQRSLARSLPHEWSRGRPK